eukprot:TRINITY_DN7598_c0_g1_i2.p1 TRINITY_DN7598_c0_g1~~TRINITY_DN7598_c0_g1_i2.p1  ORF type:complete len:274 (-),score=47.40 TRINITY_DN7598_c0_g1_i2:1070-1843(-)
MFHGGPSSDALLISGKSVPCLILRHIFIFLSHNEVLKSVYICKLFWKMVNEQKLWEHFVRQHFSRTHQLAAKCNWKTLFFNELTKISESVHIIHVAHQGCLETVATEERKKHFVPLTGVNNLVFALPGVYTIPRNLLFSSSRPTQPVPASFALWSISSDHIHRNNGAHCDRLDEGPCVGLSGVLHHRPFSIRSVTTRTISNDILFLHIIELTAAFGNMHLSPEMSWEMSNTILEAVHLWSCLRNLVIFSPHLGKLLG